MCYSQCRTLHASNPKAIDDVVGESEGYDLRYLEMLTLKPRCYSRYVAGMMLAYLFKEAVIVDVHNFARVGVQKDVLKMSISKPWDKSREYQSTRPVTTLLTLECIQP